MLRAKRDVAVGTGVDVAVVFYLVLTVAIFGLVSAVLKMVEGL